MKVSIEVDVEGKRTLKSTRTFDEATAVQEVAKIIVAYLKDFPGTEPLHIVIQR